MGMFNGLRKRIVHKLIRPEDGYMYVGDTAGVEFGFHLSDDGTYLFSERFPNSEPRYYVPTLTGWREFVDNNDEAPQAITFSEWRVGIMEDLYMEYNARMENLTRRDFNFNKRKDGESLMISKQSFCEIMSALDVYWENIRKLEGVLNVIFESNALTQILDSVADALEEELEPDLTLDEEPMLYHWMFNLDFGRHEWAKDGVEDGWPLTTAEELYDYLVWKKEFSEKTP